MTQGLGPGVGAPREILTCSGTSFFCFLGGRTNSGSARISAPASVMDTAMKGGPGLQRRRRVGRALPRLARPHQVAAYFQVYRAPFLGMLCSYYGVPHLSMRRLTLLTSAGYAAISVGHAPHKLKHKNMDTPPWVRADE
ncbi:hypothetical protein NDU88_008365 [Pleurodeles waltl]|uniref:Uncharacterized protein n=1 Tax=Pleurodeles waltl TaxID=8319 RepID=A0AAV7RVJ9_PLEWA|nr:hypothetical protein NDU88_008365 [Pleurodeles waltl]